MSVSNSPATLFVFAHRGEARSFLAAQKWSPAESGISGHYVFENQQLLITGEGGYEVLKKLSAVCSGQLPDNILNLGTCGALREDLRSGQIVSIRTAFGAEGSQPLFRSYTSADDQANLDCISSSQRVANSELAEQLANFAAVVDREAWAVGSVAEMFKIPFLSYKLVTDFADGEILLSDAAVISEQLFKYYNNSLDQQWTKTIVKTEAFNLPEAFYLTTSQRRLLKSLLTQLSIKEKTQPEKILSEVCASLEVAEGVRPKEKTSVLLQKLTDRLSPFRAELRKELNRQIRSATEAGWEIRFEPQYEDERIELKATINTKSKFVRLNEALKQLPYDDIVALLRGEKTGVKSDAL